MMEESRYQDLQTKQKECTLGYIVRALLRSRMSIGIASNQEVYDEDVNVYLAYLLLAFSDPGYLRWAGQFVTQYDEEVNRLAEATHDDVRHYIVYKSNADHLLIALGLFPHGGFLTQQERFNHGERYYISRGKVYYGMASSYNQKIYRKTTATAEVLEKLSQWFERYLSILQCARSEYFSLMKPLKEAELHTFLTDVETFGRGLKVKEKQDEFLDAYSTWLKIKTGPQKDTLKRLAEELSTLNPHFPLPPID